MICFVQLTPLNFTGMLWHVILPRGYGPVCEKQISERTLARRSARRTRGLHRRSPRRRHTCTRQ